MQPTLEFPTQAVQYSRISTRQWLVGLLFAEVITVLAPTGVLSTYFRFPDILREPARVALPLFAANQSMIVPAYYLFMLSGLLYVPLSVLLRKQLGTPASRVGADLLVGLGVATALFQAIGFSRWVFAVPYLSDAYAQATGSESLRASVVLLYEFINRYVGMTIGEHLGFLAMGGWTICLALLLPKRSQFSRWFTGAGVLTGVLLMASVGEHFGTSWSALFGLLNFVANALWTVWILILAGQIARR
jgi:hypothetical protein